MSWFVFLSFFFFIIFAFVDLTLFRFYILSFFFESCPSFIVLAFIYLFFFKIAYKMITDFNSFSCVFSKNFF